MKNEELAGAIESVKTMTLTSGDYLVVNLPADFRLSDDGRKNLTQQLSGAFPLCSGRIVILEGGIQLTVVKQGEGQ